jgi:UDP-glucose 4-epimerase
MLLNTMKFESATVLAGNHRVTQYRERSECPLVTEQRVLVDTPLKTTVLQYASGSGQEIRIYLGLMTFERAGGLAFAMKSYLITGGCGFIGVNLVKRLCARGDSVRVFDNLSTGRHEDAASLGAQVIVGDVRDARAVSEAAKGAEVVVHLAAHTRVIESITDPDLNFDINVVGTKNVLQACRDTGVQKLVFASTGGAILGDQKPPTHEEMVPRPISPYGAGKLAGEAYCSAFAGSFGLNTVALRFSNVYGPFSYHKGSVVAQFFRNLIQGKPLIVYGDGSQTRDYVFVEDLIEAVLLAEQIDTPGDVFQIASGRETSLNELIALIGKVVPDRAVNICHEPARRGEVLRNYARIEKARKTLGYEPRVPLEEGLHRTWHWFTTAERAHRASV